MSPKKTVGGEREGCDPLRFSPTETATCGASQQSQQPKVAPTKTASELHAPDALSVAGYDTQAKRQGEAARSTSLLCVLWWFQGMESRGLLLDSFCWAFPTLILVVTAPGSPCSFNTDHMVGSMLVYSRVPFFNGGASGHCP